MKLPKHAFAAYWDVHAWAGVILSLLLHAMFFTGVFALFEHPLSVWQDPRSHRDTARCDARSVEPLVATAVAASGLEPEMLFVSSLEGCTPVSVHMHAAGEAHHEATLLVDRRTGDVLPQRSVLATFLFYFHFLYEPEVLGLYGMWIAGLVGVIALLVIVTGVLIHLKDLARQLHQLRTTHRPRVLWSDLHKVVGVMGVPFQTTMVLTGAIVCLAGPLQSAYQALVFDGDAERAAAVIYGSHPLPARTDRASTRLDVDALLARARAIEPRLSPEYVWIENVGDEASTAKIAGRVDGTLFGFRQLTLSARDGAPLEGANGPESAAQTAMRWIYGLHFAWYGGDALRWLYALLGLAGCATILSGNWTWLERRDRHRARRGHRVLGRLTVGIGLGVALAVGAMFVVNRALPIDVAWHWQAEVAAFFVAWLAAAAMAFVAPSERIGARWIAAAAGAAFLATPLLAPLSTPLHLGRAIAIGGWDVAQIDLGLLVLGGALVSAAIALSRRPAERAVARPAIALEAD